MGKVKNQEWERERVLANNIKFSMVGILDSGSGETTVAGHVTWRGDHKHQLQQGRSMIPEAKWGPFWPMPNQVNTWTDFKNFDAGNFSTGEEQLLVLTQKNVNVSAANSQKAQSLDVKEWSTVKNKFAPRGQQDRLHWKRAPTTREAWQTRASGSKRSISSQEEHCKK